MAPKAGRTGTGLSERLVQAPQRFNFFQAVRLLERWQQERADRGHPHAPVGGDHPPDEEIVRFRAQASLGFPASTIAQFREPLEHAGASVPPPELVVNFLGLIGPSGILPRHYTELLIRRIRKKDYALRDFLDIFHHRLIALFHRAWEKYRLPFAYERSQFPDAEERLDCGSRGLFSLVGLGTEGLRDRLEIDDDAFVYYSGHFSHYPRSASALQSLLEDHFEMPIAVQQAQGQWLYLDPGDHARLPRPGVPGRNNELGMNLVVGARVWDIQSKFRIRLGPLNYRQFWSLMPDRGAGGALRPLCELTRKFVGAGFDFDIQPVLKPEEVRPCRLTKDEPDYRPHLNWNTWISCRPFSRALDDASFSPKKL